MTTLRAQTYDQDWERFAKWLGIHKKRALSTSVASAQLKQSKNTSVRVIQWISDLHVPFHNLQFLQRAVDVGSKLGVSTLVVGGDFLDCYSLSRFPQYKDIPIVEEYRQARLVLDWLSREYPQVLILSGNHEAREKKHFAKKLTLDEQEWLLSRSIIERISEDMKNVTVVSKIIHSYNFNWFTTVGDAWLGHYERSSTVPGKPALDFRNFAMNWHRALGLNVPRLCVIGHTHQVSMNLVGEQLCVESGCMCKFQEYALEPNASYRPQQLGFVTFQQEKERTLLDSVKIHLW